MSPLHADRWVPIQLKGCEGEVNTWPKCWPTPDLGNASAPNAERFTVVRDENDVSEAFALPPVPPSLQSMYGWDMFSPSSPLSPIAMEKQARERLCFSHFLKGVREKQFLGIEPDIQFFVKALRTETDKRLNFTCVNEERASASPWAEQLAPLSPLYNRLYMHRERAQEPGTPLVPSSPVLFVTDSMWGGQEQKDLEAGMTSLLQAGCTVYRVDRRHICEFGLLCSSRVAVAQHSRPAAESFLDRFDPSPPLAIATDAASAPTAAAAAAATAAPTVSPEVAQLREAMAGVKGQPKLMAKFEKIVKSYNMWKKRSAKAASTSTSEPKPFGLANMVFGGPPGTGKTSTVKKLARALSQLGILSTDKAVIVDKETKLKGANWGEKMRIAFQDAQGGILFFDEITQQRGKEFIEPLLTALETHKGKVMVVIAGYTEQVEKWITTSDPGMASRFPLDNRVDFDPLPLDTLVEVGLSMLQEHGFTLHESANDAMRACMRVVSEAHPPENARGVRNQIEAMMQSHDARIADTEHDDDDDDTIVTKEDIFAACPTAALPSAPAVAPDVAIGDTAALPVAPVDPSAVGGTHASGSSAACLSAAPAEATTLARPDGGDGAIPNSAAQVRFQPS